MSEQITLPNGSNLTSLEYIFPDEQEEGSSPKLLAVFRDGARYSYSGVPEEVWRRLVAEGQERGQVGSLFHRLVRAAGYPFANLDDVPIPEPDPEPSSGRERRFVRRDPVPKKRGKKDRRSREDRRRTHPPRE